jgi:LytS/YehU family sensor histidine kinase
LLKKESELNQLKAQLYPHFLFNALNNIYGYTLSGNKYGNELILKLSDLMRFILDVGTKELIPLENELQFIENYMAFEKERLGKRCLLNYRKDVSYYKREITPLLLFPFIENAFKYGANSIQPTEINILLIDNSTEFRMIIRNGILNKNTASTKLGLYNSKRRLELIYPKKHELNIKSDNGYYTSELILKYDEN